MKRLHKFLWILTVLTTSQNVVAQSNWQLVEVSSKAIDFSAPSGRVCSDYEGSVCTDVSKFYQFNQYSQWRMTLVGTLTPVFGARITLVTGVDAAKMGVEPRIILGLIGARNLGRDSTLSAEIYNSFMGSTYHRPCTDDYDREYYCGNLTAWSDYLDKRTTFKEWGLKVVYRF